MANSCSLVSSWQILKQISFESKVNTGSADINLLTSKACLKKEILKKSDLDE